MLIEIPVRHRCDHMNDDGTCADEVREGCTCDPSRCCYNCGARWYCGSSPDCHEHLKPVGRDIRRVRVLSEVTEL